LAGETEVLGENLPQRHFIHHKFQFTRLKRVRKIIKNFGGRNDAVTGNMKLRH
jgi:hypothetical protein